MPRTLGADVAVAVDHSSEVGERSCLHAAIFAAASDKQVGGSTPKAGGRELDGRTWDEMPKVPR
jgi:protein gp37